MKTLIIITSLILSCTVFAGTTYDAKISYYVVQPANSNGTDRVCIYLDREIDNSPTCNTQNRLCADLNTNIGKAQLSTIQYAHSERKTVTISGVGANGAGVCTNDNNSQDLGYISVSHMEVIEVDIEVYNR